MYELNLLNKLLKEQQKHKPVKKQLQTLNQLLQKQLKQVINFKIKKHSEMILKFK